MNVTINYYQGKQQQTIHELIRSARRGLGYTQQYVAECIHMSTRQYIKYERGELDIGDISFQQGVNLCELLHIEVYKLVTPIEQMLQDAPNL